MTLVDSISEIVSVVTHAWDDAGPLRVIIALLVPVIAWLVRGPLSNFVFKLLKLTGNAIGIELDDRIEKSVLPALRVVIVVMGALIAHESIHMPEPYFGVVDKILVSICVAAVFAALHALCKFIPEIFEKHQAARAPQQVSWVVRIAQFIVVFVGIAAVFRVWGIDIGPVLTGMGLAGAAVALAAQDYLKNLLAGFNNAAERRFREGDWIRVDGLIEGTVESVDLRSTLVRRFDKAPVYVPNSELANNLLINFSRCPHRRIYWKVALTYSTSIDTLKEIRDRIEQYIDDSGRFVAPDQAARYVRIDSFNDSSVDMLILCFTQSNVWADYLEVKEELALSIKSIVSDSGGNFAFPSRSVYVEASRDEQTTRPPRPESPEPTTGVRTQSRERSESGEQYENGDLSAEE